MDIAYTAQTLHTSLRSRDIASGLFVTCTEEEKLDVVEQYRGEIGGYGIPEYCEVIDG